MKNDDYSQSYLKQISIANIPSDIHRLGLSNDISKLLIENGVFFISQVMQMTEYELNQLQGINATNAEKIKQAVYSYRWKTSQDGTGQSMEQLRLRIENSARKNDILKISIDDLNLSAKTHKDFNLLHIRTIGDLIKINKNQILQIKGIGRFRYDGILNSLLDAVNFCEQGTVGTGNITPASTLDDSIFRQSNLTFLELLTILFNTFKPRNCEIFFKYFLTYRARHGAFKQIADQYDLTRERIRKICEKGLNLLCHSGRKNSITTYLNTVWKQKVHNFIASRGGNVTREELEQEFAADLPAIYFIQNEILQIDDIWASVL